MARKKKEKNNDMGNMATMSYTDYTSYTDVETPAAPSFSEPEKKKGRKKKSAQASAPKEPKPKSAKKLAKEQKELEKERRREAEIMAKKTPGEVAFFKQIKIVEEEVERDYASRPKENKKKGFAKLNESLKNISLAHLQKEIQGYGYEFKASEYLRNMALVLIGIAGASVFFGLKIWGIIILFLVALAVYPILTVAQAEIVSNNEDFEQIIAYIEQMTISFKNNPKTLLAWKETLPIVEGKMREKVEEAINIVETDYKSKNVYERAFKVIEDEYKCSRLRTLHRFVYTVETENSTNYSESLDNLYLDVREWQKRTYKFQAGLAATKNQLTILLVASIVIAGVFAYLMRTVETSVTIEDKITGEMTSPIQIIANPVYQIATIVFFVIFISIYTFVNTKINGSWLVNDLENPKDREVIKAMKQVALLDEAQSKKNRLIATLIMGLPLLGFSLFKKSTILIVLSLFFCIFVYLAGERSNKKKKQKVLEELKQEFPLWMRDVAISLKNRVVVRAIIETEETAAYVMKPFIRMFLINVENDPASIMPFMNFFGEYKAQELSTAIKTLYSIRTLSSEDSQRQVNALIERNQELLAESERIRQENATAGVGFIGLLPMILMALLLMVYLMVMMIQFMGLLGTIQ